MLLPPAASFVLLLLVAGPQAAALELVDDRGATVRLAQPARRVISLAPHLTELVFAAGSGERLVGTVRGSDFPEKAASVPVIGDSAGLDFERVLALQPDLVLAWGSGNRSADLDRLRRLGLNVVVLEPRRLVDIPRHLNMLGELMHGAHAQAVADEFSARLARLRGQYQARPTVSVMFEIWHRPLLTVNGDHLISDVIGLCGARNVFSDLPQLAGAVSGELVVAADPDAIVVGSEAPDAGVESWRDYGFLRAVRAGHVFTVSADLVTRQTPRILDAAAKICVDLEKVRQKSSPPVSWFEQGRSLSRLSTQRERGEASQVLTHSPA